MRELKVSMLHLASHATFKYLARRRNKSNRKHYYPSNDTEIIAGDSSIPPQAKLAYCVVMMAGSGLKSASQTNCHASTAQQGVLHDKCWPGTNIS
jgi:hypothetical protein